MHQHHRHTAANTAGRPLEQLPFPSEYFKTIWKPTQKKGNTYKYFDLHYKQIGCNASHILLCTDLHEYNYQKTSGEKNLKKDHVRHDKKSPNVIDSTSKKKKKRYSQCYKLWWAAANTKLIVIQNFHNTIQLNFCGNLLAMREFKRSPH